MISSVAHPNVYFPSHGLRYAVKVPFDLSLQIRVLLFITRLGDLQAAPLHHQAAYEIGLLLKFRPLLKRTS